MGAAQPKTAGRDSLTGAAAVIFLRIGLTVAALLFPVLMFSPFISAEAADADVGEFSIKAAYISKFGGFIHWPEGTFSSDTSPIVICVVGDSQVVAALTKTPGRPVGNRPLTIRSLKTFSPDSGCHILYAADSSADRVSQSLKAARGAGVLTVADLADGGVTAPVINFVMKENHVRFEIDERAAFENGLTISSQLLGLAVAVKTRG